MSEIRLRPIVAQAYGEIVATPYYQDGELYRYAKHLIIDDENTSMFEVKQMANDAGDDGQSGYDDIVESYQAIRNTIAQLDNITIPKPDFEAWVLQRIKSDAMVEYINVLDDLFAELTLIAYRHGSWQVTEREIEMDKWMDWVYYEGSQVMFIDYRKRDEDDSKKKHASEYVLNRKNPFADVSIKNQRFIYASDYERFNALELRTSRKITKVDKDEDRSFVTLQPGFNIRNSPKIEGGAKSNIRFDDTLTTEITQDDDKTYVYLDARSLSSD